MKHDENGNLVASGLVALLLGSTPVYADPAFELTIQSPGPAQILGSPVPVSESRSASVNVGIASAGGPAGTLTTEATAAAGSGYLKGSSAATLNLSDPWGTTSGFAQENSTFYLDNIQITGPEGSSSSDIVDYSVNLDITGLIRAAATGTSFFAGASASLHYSTSSSLGGFGNLLVGSINLDHNGSVAATGVFSGFPINSFAAVSGMTGSWQARHGDVISVSLMLSTGASAGKSTTFESGSADSLADFSHTAMFAASGAVFNLPDGWTASSLDSCIVDNTYRCAPSAAPIPEPEIYAMLGVGLGFMGWAARRKKPKEAA